MDWYDKVNELQSEIFGKILDYVEKNGDNDDVRYIEECDTLYFKIGDNWLDEYSVTIFDVADIADMLGIKCPEE